MDPLDHLFASMRVRSALHARLEASAPWGVRFIEGRNARFGLVLDGACWLETEDGFSRRLGPGDCYVLMHGASYRLVDAPGSPTLDCATAIGRLAGGVVRLGEAERTSATVVTGWFTFDAQSAAPLLALLPRVLLATVDTERSSMLRALLELLAAETAEPRAGSGVVVSRLADILFIHVIRNHAAATDPVSGGWLSALSDRHLGPALRALHDEPGRSWTLVDLAQHASLSRSAFAERFTRHVGEPPRRYLTRWRMHLACQTLRDGRRSLGEIASACGYESDAAFSKVFRRVIGTSPGRYRSARATGDGLGH